MEFSNKARTWRSVTDPPSRPSAASDIRPLACRFHGLLAASHPNKGFQAVGHTRQHACKAVRPSRVFVGEFAEMLSFLLILPLASDNNILIPDFLSLSSQLVW